MKYEIEMASGKDFDISWGNFLKRKYFEENCSIFNLKAITGYFQAIQETYIRDGKVVKYVYGHYGTTPKEIFEKCLREFTNNNRVIRHIDSETFQLGKYKYYIEINSLDDLNRLMNEFDERLILGDKSIIIYDSYVE